METITETIPQAPTSINIAGPHRGHYNMLSHEESDRYKVTVNGIVCSTTVDLDRSDEISELDWPELIAAITKDAQRWWSTNKAVTDARDAIHEWINREDPEDERLMAIEEAQMRFETDGAIRKLRSLPRHIRVLITAELAANPL